MSRSTSTEAQPPEACPHCGQPAATMADFARKQTIARCGAPEPCNPNWMPLSEWNDPTRRGGADERPLVLSPEEAPLDAMASAAPKEDALAAWGAFKAQVEAIKKTAETLTVTSADQKEEMALARATRFSLRDIRLAVTARHKDLKADALRVGQAMDAAKRQLLAVIEPLEARLLEQEQYEQRQIGAAREALQTERVEILRGLVENPETMAHLADMPEQEFYRYRDFCEAEHTAKLKREREAQAETQRQAEEREALRVENERLRAEVAEADECLAVAAEVARTIKEAADRERQAAAAAPDREKLLAWAAMLDALELPVMTSSAGEAITVQMAVSRAKFAAWVKEKARAL